MKNHVSCVTLLFALLSLIVLTPVRSLAAERPKVLVLSIDGLRPDLVTQADKYELKIPTLRSLLKEGTFASGVVGVVPTYTYPSHATLMTGVWPAEHGIHSNVMFDPRGEKSGLKYTDFSEFKSLTLWQAAHQAKYVTANVGWPVTTGTKEIDYLMPANPLFEGRGSPGDGDDAGPVKAEPTDKPVHYDNPPGLRETLAADLPADANISFVDRRYHWAQSILRRYKPDFMTVHLGGYDGTAHRTGPFSKPSLQELEAIDGKVAQLMQLHRANSPIAYVVIVSDHGFEATEKTVHLNALFAQHGLFKRKTDTDPGSWDAAVWPQAGRPPSCCATRPTRKYAPRSRP